MILQKVRHTLARHRMAAPGQRICVAVSGGPDSTALLLALHTLRDELGIAVSTCHVNHRLRGEESDGDERFVRELAARLGVPCHVAAVDVKKYKGLTGGSTQVAARDLRYLFFRRLITRGNADAIATAHTASDNAETLLINLLRGAGPQGLSGIPPVREGNIIRPLIETRKGEILRWLEGRGQPFRTDSSNASPAYQRNRVRSGLLPFIQREFNPGAEDTLLRTAEILTDTQEYLAREAAKALAAIARKEDRRFVLPCAEFKKLPAALQREMVRQAVAEVRKSLAGISFDHLESLRGLACGGGAGGEIALKGITGRTAHGKFHLAKTSFTAVGEFSYPFSPDGTVAIPEAGCAIVAETAERPPAAFDRHCETVYLDADTVPPTAVLRNRRDGDTFKPLGAPGGRKLKKFFIDEKIPRWERDRLVLLADGNEVLWIAGMRLSDKVKLTPDTKQIVKVEINRARSLPGDE